MTFEEFEQLAKNPPKKEGKSIFVLEQVIIDDLPDERRQHYPRYSISTERTLYCTSLEEAEECLSKLVDRSIDAISFEDVFCYYLTEYTPNDVNYCHKSCYESRRVYNPAGELLDQTHCAGYVNFNEEDDPYSVYRGRTKEQIRFKSGDIVEMVYRDEVMLGFVVSTPPTIEECWKGHQRSLEYFLEHLDISKEEFDILYQKDIAPMFNLDGSDDCYIVLTTSDYRSHTHVDSLRIFEPHFPIPNYMRKRLEERYGKYLLRTVLEQADTRQSQNR